MISNDFMIYHYLNVRQFGGRFLLLAVIIAGWLWTQASATAAAGLKVGDRFPALSGFALDGKIPESLKDKVLLVDFWASWCDPCKASFPAMEALHKTYKEKGLVIIAVNVDENRSDMDDFLKKNVATFLVLRDAAQKLVEMAGIKTMPSSFLVDREGKIKYVHSGYLGEATRKKYEQEVQELLQITPNAR